MLSKPISEVAAEFNPEDRCTPSYVRVPATFPKIKYSGRTPLAEEVLNEAWVSIISGSEDYSFKVCDVCGVAPGEGLSCLVQQT
jgi:histone deacetylase complex regulatory component SIN3